MGLDGMGRCEGPATFSMFPQFWCVGEARSFQRVKIRPVRSRLHGESPRGGAEQSPLSAEVASQVFHLRRQTVQKTKRLLTRSWLS